MFAAITFTDRLYYDPISFIGLMCSVLMFILHFGGGWRENPGGLVTRGGRGDSDLDLKSECRGDGRRCVKMALRENDAVGR